MTTPSTDEGSTAQQIWEQLDREESGATPAPVFDEPSAPAQQQPQAPAPAVTEEPPAPAAPAAPAADAPQAPTPGSQDLLDKIAGLESQLTQVTGRLRNAEGHIGNLNGQLKQQLAAAAQVTDRGAAAPSAEQIRDAQGSAKAMEALKKDYPEFGAALEVVLAEQRKELEKQFTGTAQQPQAQVPGVTQADLEGLRGELRVDAAHPGWQQRVKTPEFSGWLQRQPREVQLLAQSDVPDDAIRLLDLHRDGTKPAAQTASNTSLVAAAAIPTGRGSASPRAKPVEEMTDAEYWNYLDSLDKQKQG